MAVAKDEGPATKGLVGVRDKKSKTPKGGTSYTGASGQYAWRKPAPVGTAITPQQQNIKSPAQIAREAAIIAKDGALTGVGGGGGPSALDRYTQAIQGMLTSGSYRQPQDDLLAKLTEMYGQAQPQINTAMDNLTGFLQGQSNPYAGLEAQRTEVSPDSMLSELLQSQGVSQTPLQQLAAVTQAQNTGQSDAFQNLIGSMQNMWQGNQAGQISDVAAQRAGLQTQLENSRLGAGTQLNTQAAGQQQDLMKMLLEALSKGGRPNKGGLFGESNTAARLPIKVGRKGK
jgi:hypothetical protein